MTEIEKVVCTCGFIVFNGSVLKARVLKFEDDQGIAKCKRCKREIVIPNIRLFRKQRAETE